MSLDISLISEETIKQSGTGVFVRENGKRKELTPEEIVERFPGAELEAYPLIERETNEVFDWNITHNLSSMAERAGLYVPLWRPEDVDCTHARHILLKLEVGLKILLAKPHYFKEFNPENGWGSYENLVECVEAYIEACRKYPNARIEVDR